MIRKVEATDYPRLMEIWESAVSSTHDFLKEEDFLYYKEQLPVYFQHVTLFGFEQEGILIGFMGIAEGNLEMLFVDDNYRGIGIGKRLITYAIGNLQVTKVDVNEQNIQAVGFYKYMGFSIYKRSNLDGEGKEYPILGVGGNDLKQAYVISNIPDSLKHNAEVKLWIQSQNENGIFKSSFPVISEYPHQFAVYGTLGLIGFLIPSGYIICQLLGLYKKWLHIDQELFWKVFSLVVGYFGLMVSFIAGTTMQLYLYWIMLGTMISLLLSIKNEIL